MKKWLDKYENGGEFLGTTDKGFDYNGAWGGQWQNGGEIMNVASLSNPIAQLGGNVLPGAAGWMYSRHGAPSEGKYAKKTTPSAQTGKLVRTDLPINIHTNQIVNNERNPEYVKQREIAAQKSDLAEYIKKKQNYTKEHSDVYTDPETGKTVVQSIGIQPTASPIDAAVLGAAALYSGGAELLGSMINLANPIPIPSKLNLFSKFKPNPDAYYRMLGKEGYEDAISSGVLRPKQSGVFADRATYYTKGVPNDKFNPVIGGGTKKGTFYEGPYMAEVSPGKYFPEEASTLNKSWSFGKTSKDTHIPITSDNVKLYKQHWLKGYKEVPKPKSNFKSEIEWAKWNPETPNYPELINEYNIIEENTKKAGTWMKNSDGSKFQGTPEQFIQQQSRWFNKAFPQGFDTGYRGAHQHITDFKNRERNDYATFLTNNKEAASTYAGYSENFYNPAINPKDQWVSRLYEIAIPKTENVVTSNAQGRNWRLLDWNDDIVRGVRTENGIDPISAHRHNLLTTDLPPEGFNPNKNYLSTDIYANYVKNPKNTPLAKIENVVDQMGIGKDLPQNVYIVDANRLPLKSLRHNVGFFDMTNPDIYKVLFPTIGAGSAVLNYDKHKNGGTTTSSYYQHGLDFQPKTISEDGSVIKDDRGQWAHPGEVTQIGSGDITMKDVPYPVLGVSDIGDAQMMYPEQDYQFEGSSVTEYPMAKNGINQLDEKTAEHLDQLLNFTNLNKKAKTGGWLQKYS